MGSSRTWTDEQLKTAVKTSGSWRAVLRALGLNGTSAAAIRVVRQHAIRLGVNFAHLGSREPAAAPPPEISPDLAHLRQAGPSVAAAWFAIRGCAVPFPVEPTIYDLVASMPEGLRRVQVKTTTSRDGSGWHVAVGRRSYSADKGGPRGPYDPDAVDYFFIVDGDLAMYLIPTWVIAGRVGLALRAYRKYVVGNAAGLLAVGAGADDAAARVSA